MKARAIARFVRMSPRKVRLVVDQIRGKSVKLGFTFPEGASVLRRELFERIQDEKAQASAAGQPADSVRLPGHQEAAHGEHRSGDRLAAKPATDGNDGTAHPVTAARSVR